MKALASLTGTHKSVTGENMHIIRVTSADSNPGDQCYGTDCLSCSTLDETQRGHASETHCKHAPCERDVMRFLEYYAKKDTLMMIVDVGQEIHFVCETHKRRLIRALSPADHAQCVQCINLLGKTYGTTSREVETQRVSSTATPQNPVSKFGGLFLLEGLRC